MTEDKNADPLLEDFEVETLFENRVHERLAFTFKVEGEEFKGHFHNDEILWLNPHPKQMIGVIKVDKIESTIHSLMRHYGISKEIQGLTIKPMFEDTAHERQQFSLQVQGAEYKGFVHKGDIQWFHPQPQQKLEDDLVQVMESEIHEKVAQHELNNKENPE
ncbi:hypothetical protein [Paenibacillus antarcticus]|uniref:Uncharacterized protein n=1 Tax=Paenibacillus antarcticus TaxID=253703 RepID=A0A168N9T2_9BACL|nr:hypothetical protein [Paenibacillus antarcticus]OAB45555.1 hypothetical protein PBAT_11560 [Paenibacillus antarcticus]